MKAQLTITDPQDQIRLNYISSKKNTKSISLVFVRLCRSGIEKYLEKYRSKEL